MAPGDIATPLHVPRKALIGRLEERLAEEVKAREEAEAKAAASRQSLLDIVENLTTDQVANLLTHYVHAPSGGLEKWLSEYVVEGKRFVSQPLVKKNEETRLEKTVRVLQLANDETIEVQPTDPIFPLL